MKKILIVILAVFALNFSSNSASSISFDPSNANSIFIPMNKNMQISLKDLSVISVKDYEAITGQKMSFFKKITFKAGQKKLRNNIAADGTITNKKLLKAMKNADPTAGINGGWLVLGLLLGLIGVLLSYVINGDEAIKKNRQKWAWIGFAVWVVIVIIAAI